MEHRQGPATCALAPVRKTIYSLKDLREILLSCNRRYLEYFSSLDDFSAGIRALNHLTQPRPVKGRNLKGLNFFSRASRPCSPPSSVPASISLVSAAPTYCRSLADPLPPPYPDNSPVCAISASSNASSAPIATISPAPAAPPSLPAAASPNTPSFLLWPDKSAHKMQTLRS